MQQENLAAPNHQVELGRLNRVSGQIDGIKKMINEQRYCIDILIQLKAARSALKNIEMNILERHFQNCLEQTIKAEDTSALYTKIKELCNLVKTYE